MHLFCHPWRREILTGLFSSQELGHKIKSLKTCLVPNTHWFTNATCSSSALCELSGSWGFILDSAAFFAPWSCSLCLPQSQEGILHTTAPGLFLFHTQWSWGRRHLCLLVPLSFSEWNPVGSAGSHAHIRVHCPPWIPHPPLWQEWQVPVMDSSIWVPWSLGRRDKEARGIPQSLTVLMGRPLSIESSFPYLYFDKERRNWQA